MEELKIIHHKEFGVLNVAVINGKEYFRGTACAGNLGYKSPADAVRKHCKGVFEIATPTNGGIQKVKYISEGDLYRLIVHSRLASAERFERWVFDEVLPEIRKNGVYGSGSLERVPEIVSATVREILPGMLEGMLKEMPGKEGKRKKPNRAHGKIDRLPKEIREKVIYMLCGEKDTYKEIQTFLSRNGYNVHLSSVGRFNRRMENEITDFLKERG